MAFSTKLTGNHHLQGNVQVYNVRIPVGATKVNFTDPAKGGRARIALQKLRDGARKRVLDKVISVNQLFRQKTHTHKLYIYIYMCIYIYIYTHTYTVILNQLLCNISWGMRKLQAPQVRFNTPEVRRGSAVNIRTLHFCHESHLQCAKFFAKQGERTSKQQSPSHKFLRHF